MDTASNQPVRNGNFNYPQGGYTGDSSRLPLPKYPGYVQRSQRVGIFVDVQNLFYSARNIYDSKINFEKLRVFITARRRLIRAIAYLVQREGVDQGGFIEALRRFGYETKVKLLKERADGSAKGDWDMGIALDTLALADHLDTVVIVSGDGDFVPLVQVLKTRGVRVEVVAFERSTAGELREAADLYVPVEEDLLIKGAKRSIPDYGEDEDFSLEDIS